MSHHACYAMPAEFLDIVLIDEAKPMQAILRQMLAGLRARRIRIFDDIREAMESMLREPPNLVITDWKVGDLTASQLLKMMRSPNMDPLCFVPLIVITAQATQSVLDRVMRGGGHLLLVKPISPSTLIDRIHWLIADHRHFVLGENNRFMIAGVEDKLNLQKQRMDVLKRARAFHDERIREKMIEKADAPKPKRAQPLVTAAIPEQFFLPEPETPPLAPSARARELRNAYAALAR